MSTLRASRKLPPEDLPIYRVLTGPDDDTFCKRVSDAIAIGYILHGAPALAFNGKDVVVAQALIWPATKGVVTMLPS